VEKKCKLLASNGLQAKLGWFDIRTVGCIINVGRNLKSFGLSRVFSTYEASQTTDRISVSPQESHRGFPYSPHRWRVLPLGGPGGQRCSHEQTNHPLSWRRFSVAAVRSHWRRNADKLPRAPLGMLWTDQGGGHGPNDVTLGPPNKADAPNPAMTSSFQIERHWRRVGDLRRWAAVANFEQN
jgi:hypothetical protein